MKNYFYLLLLYTTNQVYSFSNNVKTPYINRSNNINRVFCDDYYNQYNKNKKSVNNDIEKRLWRWFGDNIKNKLEDVFTNNSNNLCNDDSDCDFPNMCCDIGSIKVCCNPMQGVDVSDLQYAVIPIPIEHIN